MEKNAKKVNPYEKKKKRKLKITRKQWIAIIALLSVIVLIVGIVVAVKLSGNGEHYEGDGHNHGTEDSHSADDGHNHDGHNHGSTNDATKVKAQLYSNADNTYRLVFRDNSGKVLREVNDIPNNPGDAEAVDADKGVYCYGWDVDGKPNHLKYVYYNIKTGQVSEVFLAPYGCDGVRVAYSSADEKSIIVQDLFDAKAYQKEYPLAGIAPDKYGYTILSGVYKDKIATVTYSTGEDGSARAAKIPLYE